VNYTELTAAIKGYAENDFPETVGSFTSASQIATFVQEAEQRIYNSIQILALRKNSTGVTTGGNQYLSAPVDWLSTFSLAVIDPVTGEYEYLLDKDVNFIRQAYPRHPMLPWAWSCITSTTRNQLLHPSTPGLATTLILCCSTA